MLIEFLFEELLDWEEASRTVIGGLQVFYRASKQRFDEDPPFKKRAQSAVVKLQGESFYNPYVPGVLVSLSSLGLVEESQGARVICIEGFDEPLIVVKSNGGYNYATTDLTALWRPNELVGFLPKVIYVPGQTMLDLVLFLVKMAKGSEPRSAEVVRLVDLFDEAKTRRKVTHIEHCKLVISGLVSAPVSSTSWPKFDLKILFVLYKSPCDMHSLKIEFC
ncbi:hypothetical protein CDL15_Pgr005708 [Punica granatum]|uniref:Arginyl-tRNA synthetase catalytic core domain-containing protein n=1 Tax=Punica granatum TaxID=22663 RepID=A0A218WH34_PUNGR|nr:hypothetical protein CDL15_Pgr005708 [Punica granatum]